MSSQKTLIANMALIHIGVSKLVTNVDTENSNEARLIRQCFDTARDSTLEDFPWPFARKYYTLNLVGGSEDDAVNNDWQYSYRYPSDCLFVRRLSTVAGRNLATPPPYSTGIDDGGRLIYTDEADAVIEYTARVDDPAFFSTLFIEALSWKIAGIIAPPLSKIKDADTKCERGFMLVISKAQARALNEGEQDDPVEAELIRARE